MPLGERSPARRRPAADRFWRGGARRVAACGRVVTASWTRVYGGAASDERGSFGRTPSPATALEGPRSSVWQGRGTHVRGRPDLGPGRPWGEATTGRAVRPHRDVAGCFSHPNPTAHLEGVRRGTAVSRSAPGRHRAPAKSPASAFGHVASAVGGTAGAAAKTGAVLAVSGGLVASLGLQANAAPSVPAAGSVRAAAPSVQAAPVPAA